MDRMEFLERLTKAIEDCRADIARGYGEYVNVAYAIAHEYGETGRECFKRICRLCDLYQEDNAKALYDYALKHADGRVTMGTVVELAKRKGVAVPRACKRHVAHSRRMDAMGAKGETDGNHRDDPKSQKGGVDPMKIIGFLRDMADFRYNEILGHTEIFWREDFKCEVRSISDKAEYAGSPENSNDNSSLKSGEWSPLSDRDVSTLWVLLSNAGIAGNERHINSVIQSENTPRYNPFTEYFEGLPVWDGSTDHIQRLADRVRLVDDSPGQRAYLSSGLRKWLVAMVASLVRPDIVNHEIITFIGR